MNETPDQPVALSYDDACDEYEASMDFIDEAINELQGVNADDLTAELRDALTRWYRKTDTYRQSVDHFIEEAARP